MSQVSSTNESKHDAVVLIVDRKAEALTAIKKVLQHQRLQIHTASKNSEAFNFLASNHVDVLIAEFECNDNGVSGLGLVEKIRQLHPHLPFVVLSSVNDTETAVAAMRLGASDYLLKPLNEERLVESVAHTLTSSFANKQKNDYQESLVEVVATRTNLLRQALEDLEQACDFTLEALGDALDLRDSETEGHSQRVTAYSIALARAMRLPTKDVKVIARGAFLHDIGKMAIPDSILLKPGPLTSEEKIEMRSHCERGYSILKKIPYLKEAAEIVYSHQEFFDGSGYPRGLKGEEIHLGARIFSISDTLDAITSDRPYRSAKSFDYARKEIERCSGTQFDPAIVSVFLAIPNSFWQQIRADILLKHRSMGTLARELE